MRPSALLATALLLFGPALLSAQDRRLTERLDPITAGAVQHLVDSARTAGLPTEPLVQKALEGNTLGASGERIGPPSPRSTDSWAAPARRWAARRRTPR